MTKRKRRMKIKKKHKITKEERMGALGRHHHLHRLSLSLHHQSPSVIPPKHVSSSSSSSVAWHLDRDEQDQTSERSRVTMVSVKSKGKEQHWMIMMMMTVIKKKKKKMMMMMKKKKKKVSSLVSAVFLVS